MSTHSETVWAAQIPSATRRLGRFLNTPKGLLAAIFVPLLAVAGTAAGWSAVLPHLAAAVSGACLVDVLLAWLNRNTLAWPTSGLLSGLILGFVLGPETPWAATLALGALASASKYVITVRRRHVFNPAALALLASGLLFGTGQSWWGALPDLSWLWLLALLAGGALVVDRVEKFPLVLSFLGSYFGALTALALANPARVAALFRTPFLQAALFLALFMLTDPPTAPGRLVDQLWIGGLVALVSCAAWLLGGGQTYLLVGLLAGNLALAGRRWSAGARPLRERLPGQPGSTNRALDRTGRLAPASASFRPDRATQRVTTRG